MRLFSVSQHDRKKIQRFQRLMGSNYKYQTRKWINLTKTLIGKSKTYYIVLTKNKEEINYSYQFDFYILKKIFKLEYRNVIFKKSSLDTYTLTLLQMDDYTFIEERTEDLKPSICGCFIS